MHPRGKDLGHLYPPQYRRAMGDALGEAGPAGLQCGKDLPAKKVAIKAQILVARINHRREGKDLSGGLKARPGLGEPGPKEPALAKGSARRHGPKPPQPRTAKQTKKDRFGLILLVMGKQ